MAANTPKIQRKYVPAEFDAADVAQIEPLYKELQERAIASAAELEKWLLDLSETAAVIDEYGARRYIDKSCHTDDAEIEKRYMHFIEAVEPRLKPIFFALQKKYLASPHRKKLMGKDSKRFFVLDRSWKTDVELFRDENVPLETQVTKQVSQYDKICGAMMVDFEGKQLTMQQMAKFLEKIDRPLRQRAWEASANRRLRDRAALEEIYDKCRVLRQQIAKNAGLKDYRQFAFKAHKRFDYTPEDCVRFAEAIEKTCVPLVDELDRRRALDLGLEKLRPCDLGIDPKGRPPLEPFKEDQTDVFVEKVRTIFERIAPPLARDFESLRTHKNLDLASRKGKQPGGYQCALEESRQPFVFMNATGLQRDVDTLLHEGGHAFHCLAASKEPLVFLRSAPMEFCEVASMSMELLGSDYYDVFYNAADAARAKRSLIEGIIRFLPWMAVIDLFQHWVYTHPGQTADQRTAYWLSLLDRYSGKIDWAGYDELRQSSWQRQLHLFHSPFYYVEYGIAQLGALQLWLKSRQDPKKAVANYRVALSLGGTRPLPELFAAAGIRFDFSTQTLAPLMQALGEELARLPS